MRIRARWILGVAAGALGAGTAIAQPPPPPAPQPQPPRDPPPTAPDPNWAPPLPEEAPPAEPEPGTQPAGEGAVPPETAVVEPPPEEEPPDRTTLEIYGFAMFDGGYDFGQIGDPLWQDTLRPTKLPSFEDEFGRGGRTFMGVRQSRFGVKGTTPTDHHGDVKAVFEFELFGTGVDEGQTTFRLRHAYGDWWQIRAGQTWSPFMDADVFPNSVEYWGPNGMVFFRNVQLAWMPVQGDTRVTIALERPGASPDTGIYTGRIELDNVVARFEAPDVSAEARFGGDWGYVELAGILRWIKWDDLSDPVAQPIRIDGDAVGWGLNASSNLKLGPATFKLQAVYGEAIQNYMNDAGADVGAETTTDPLRPLDGVALPCFGAVAFVDLQWNEHFTSTAGYSHVWIDNSEAQAPDAFHIGNYALGNLLWHPNDRFFIGGEFQWGRRENADDGWDVNDYRFQISAKYSFSKTFGGEK